MPILLEQRVDRLHGCPRYTLFCSHSSFWFFGPYTPASVWALLGLKYVALSIVPILLLRMCRRTYPGIQSYLVLPIYLCLIFYSSGTFFSMTDDVWLVLLMVAVLFYNSLVLPERLKIKKAGTGLGDSRRTSFSDKPGLRSNLYFPDFRAT